MGHANRSASFAYARQISEQPELCGTRLLPPAPIVQHSAPIQGWRNPPLVVQNVSKIRFGTILLLNQTDKMIEPPQAVGSIGLSEPCALERTMEHLK